MLYIAGSIITASLLMLVVWNDYNQKDWEFWTAIFLAGVFWPVFWLVSSVVALMDAVNQVRNKD